MISASCKLDHQPINEQKICLPPPPPGASLLWKALLPLFPLHALTCEKFLSPVSPVKALSSCGRPVASPY